MATGTPYSDQGVPNEDKGPAILGTTLTVAIVALITMAMRLYVRIRMIRNVGWDDYVMTSAMILCIIGQIIIVPEVRLGAGRHKQYIDPADFANAYKLNFVTQPIYLFAICLVKISVGSFLLRFTVAPVYRRIIIGVIAFMGFYTIGCFFTIVLQCTNIAVQWDPNITATCWSPHTIKALGYTNMSLNLITDVLFSIIIPVPLLWNLQMNKRKKLSLIFILSLGLFATAAALVRASYLASYGKNHDWLWDSSELTIWAVVESNIGIMAGNLPCLKPLFRAVLGSTHSRSSHATTVPMYGHRSRPFGPGSRRKSLNGKGWGVLANSRTADGEPKCDGDGGPPRSYGVTDSYLLTTINADHSPKATRRCLSGRGEDGESVRDSNVESLARGLDSIKVSIKVSVIESPSPSDCGSSNAEKTEGRNII